MLHKCYQNRDQNETNETQILTWKTLTGKKQRTHEGVISLYGGILQTLDDRPSLGETTRVYIGGNIQESLEDKKTS